MEEEKYIREIAELEKNKIAGEVVGRMQDLSSNQYYVQEQEKNLIEAQLEVRQTLTDIYHLLRQDEVVESSEEGLIKWVPLKDQRKRILTDYAVNSIMRLMSCYVNKETLLSNFDEKEIKRRMLEFSLAWNANLFMKYELYFRKPSIDECKDILLEKIQEEVKKKKYAAEIAGIEINEEEARKKLLSEIENRLDYELEKIRRETIRQNLREYELIFVELKAIVEAVHQRAWKGEERKSLRRNTYLAELKGSVSPEEFKSSSEGGFKWFKK